MPLMIGPGLLYAQIPSVAGTWTGHVLERAGLAAQRQDLVPGWSSHMRLADVPPEVRRGRVALAGIRSIPEWYLGRFHHALDGDGSAGPLLAPWAGTATPTTPLEWALALCAPSPTQAHRDWTPTERWWVPWHAGERPIQWCVDQGCGLHTWLVVHTYMDPAAWRASIEEIQARLDEWLLVDRWVLADNATESLCGHLRDLGRLTSDAERVIREVPPLNTARQHGGPRSWSGVVREYLDDEDIEVMLERDRLVVTILDRTALIPGE